MLMIKIINSIIGIKSINTSQTGPVKLQDLRKTETGLNYILDIIFLQFEEDYYKIRPNSTTTQLNNNSGPFFRFIDFLEMS